MQVRVVTRLKRDEERDLLVRAAVTLCWADKATPFGRGAGVIGAAAFAAHRASVRSKRG